MPTHLAGNIPKKEQFIAHVEYDFCLRWKKQKRLRIELSSSQILCTSSDKENPVNAMDLKSGSTIIGKPERPPRMFRKEGTQPSRRDGKKNPAYRGTQRENGWTLDCCIFLDNFKTVKIDSTATWDERDGHQNQFVLRWKDENSTGKM